MKNRRTRQKTFGAKHGKPTTNSAHMASTPETLTVRWRSRRCPKELKTLLPFNIAAQIEHSLYLKIVHAKTEIIVGC